MGQKGDPGPYEQMDRNGTTVIQGEKGKPGPPGYAGEKGHAGPDGPLKISSRFEKWKSMYIKNVHYYL